MSNEYFEDRKFGINPITQDNELVYKITDAETGEPISGGALMEIINPIQQEGTAVNAKRLNSMYDAIEKSQKTADDAQSTADSAKTTAEKASETAEKALKAENTTITKTTAENIGLSSSNQNVEAALASIPNLIDVSSDGGNTVFQNAINGFGYHVNPYKNRVEIKSSQNWVCPAGVTRIGVFMVGGGAGSFGMSGGSGGFTQFYPEVSVIPGKSYSIYIGAGGGTSLATGAGGDTSAFDLIAKGALATNSVGMYYVGTVRFGGSAGAIAPQNQSFSGLSGASDGGDITYHTSNVLIMGQGYSTRDPYSGILYAGGGASGAYSSTNAFALGGAGGGGAGGNAELGLNGEDGISNTGGGGGGSGNGSTSKPSVGGKGGSGIVVIYY